jgi:hypothetical protein
MIPVTALPPRRRSLVGWKMEGCSLGPIMENTILVFRVDPEVP